MNKTSIRALAAIVAVSLAPAPASAGILPQIPLMLPDICVFGHCIQFTHASALAQIQNEIMQIRNLTTMNAGGLLQNIAATVATVTQTAQANPTRSGDAAATEVLAQAAQAAGTQAAIDRAAQTASGAEQRAQLAEASVSVTNGQLIAGNAMHAAQIQHQQQTEDAEQTFFEGAFTHSQEGGGFQ